MITQNITNLTMPFSGIVTYGSVISLSYTSAVSDKSGSLQYVVEIWNSSKWEHVTTTLANPININIDKDTMHLPDGDVIGVKFRVYPIDSDQTVIGDSNTPIETITFDIIAPPSAPTNIKYPSGIIKPGVPFEISWDAVVYGANPVTYILEGYSNSSNQWAIIMNNITEPKYILTMNSSDFSKFRVKAVSNGLAGTYCAGINTIECRLVSPYWSFTWMYINDDISVPKILPATDIYICRGSDGLFMNYQVDFWDGKTWSLAADIVIDDTLYPTTNVLKLLDTNTYNFTVPVKNIKGAKFRIRQAEKSNPAVYTPYIVNSTMFNVTVVPTPEPVTNLQCDKASYSNGEVITISWTHPSNDPRIQFEVELYDKNTDKLVTAYSVYGKNSVKIPSISCKKSIQLEPRVKVMGVYKTYSKTVIGSIIDYTLSDIFTVDLSDVYVPSTGGAKNIFIDNMSQTNPWPCTIEFWDGTQWVTKYTDTTIVGNTNIPLTKPTAPILGAKLRIKFKNPTSLEYGEYIETKPFNVYPNELPGAVSNISLVGGVYKPGSIIHITWDPAVDPDGDGLEYVVSIVGITNMRTKDCFIDFIVPTTSRTNVTVMIRPIDSKGGYGRTATSTQKISIYMENEPDMPEIVSGPNQIVNGGSDINLKWNPSFDVEGDTITYNVDFYNGTSWQSVSTGLTIPEAKCSVPDDNIHAAKFRITAYDGKLYSTPKETIVFSIFKKGPGYVLGSNVFGLLNSALTSIKKIISNILGDKNISIIPNDISLKTLSEVETTLAPVLDEAKNYTIKAVAGLNQFKIEKVDILPTSDIKEKTIYMVPLQVPGQDNMYSEYMYIDSKWEYMGSKKADLSNYDDKTAVDTKLTALSTLNSGITKSEMDEINASLWP